MKRIVWTEAHRREALRRTYEIAAEIAVANPRLAWWICPSNDAGIDGFDFESEQAWRETLAKGPDDQTPGLDPERIDREVRHIDDLASGKRVQEVGWRAVRHFDELGQFHEDRDLAQDEADEEDVDDTGRGRVVRVRRTRKAP